MNAKDTRVVAAMGSHVAELQKLAALVREQPATKKYVAAQIAKILNAMSADERAELRQALKAAKR